MIARTTLAAIAAAFFTLAGTASQAQQHDPATPPAVANKVFLSSDSLDVAVTEMRIQRKNDVLVVQADMVNMGRSNRTVYYRFRWTDSAGNQIGDGESWKQMQMNGLARQTAKSVAPTSAVTDFQLEMSVDRPR